MRLLICFTLCINCFTDILLGFLIWLKKKSSSRGKGIGGSRIKDLKGSCWRGNEKRVWGVPRGDRKPYHWEDGNDIEELVRDTKIPVIPVPVDISAEDQKSRLKLRMWEISVQTYCDRESQLKWNKHALFALLKDGVSKIIRAKFKKQKRVHQFGNKWGRFMITDSIWWYNVKLWEK